LYKTNLLYIPQTYSVKLLMLFKLNRAYRRERPVMPRTQLGTYHLFTITVVIDIVN